jgi:type IV secretory pathway VirD2 relaxase
MTDLRPFVRDLIRYMEKDLGTRLDWVAADHFNTGYPHTARRPRSGPGDGAPLH